MDRKKLLEKIENARISHMRWIQRAQHLIEDLPITEDMIPLDYTKCEFGEWLYSDGLKFKEYLRTSRIIQKIEEEHTLLHHLYLKIYKIFFVDAKRGALGSMLLGKYKKVSHENRLKAAQYFQELQDSSQRLMSYFDSFAKDVRSLEKAQIRAILS